MTEAKKKTLDKLDEINLLWVLRQISVGNLVRGIEYLVHAFAEIKNCLSSACCKQAQEQEQTVDEQENPKASKKVSKK